MIDIEIVNGLQQRYSHINPLIFQRSVERARNPGDLFDILESLPTNFPIMWSDEQHRWIHTEDLFQAEDFEIVRS